ncbi:MAG: hypothetical protein ACK58U_07785 [Rubrivivax sp.]|jgi:hypothetical protein
MKSRIKSLCVTALLSLSGAASALSFNFTFLPDTSQQAKDAFNTAAASWSSLLIDDVKLNMTVGLSKLADGQVGEATTPTVSVAYSTFFAALAGDVTSFHDVVAFGSRTCKFRFTRQPTRAVAAAVPFPSRQPTA